MKKKTLFSIGILILMIAVSVLSAAAEETSMLDYYLIRVYDEDYRYLDSHSSYSPESGTYSVPNGAAYLTMTIVRPATPDYEIQMSTNGAPCYMGDTVSFSDDTLTLAITISDIDTNREEILTLLFDRSEKSSNADLEEVLYFAYDVNGAHIYEQEKSLNLKAAALNIEVPDTTVKVELLVELKDRFAEFSILDENKKTVNMPATLSSAKNVFYIEVTAENGNIRTYTVNVNKTSKVQQDLDKSGVTTGAGSGQQGNTASSSLSDTKITTPQGQPPVNNGDGGVTLPGGGTATVAGGTEIDAPSGTVVAGDGSVHLPENEGGTVRTPGGTVLKVPGGTVIENSGKIRIPSGGEAVVVTYGTDGTLTVPAGYTIEILDPETPLASGLQIYFDNPFTDVNESNWFYGAVAFAYTHNLFSGTSAVTFDPYAPMTRGMIATVLYKLAGSPGIDGDVPLVKFADVPDGKYYSAAVAWAAANGIVSGNSDGAYAPDTRITRQDLALIIYKYARFMEIDLTEKEGLPDFTDGSAIAEYAKEAVYAFQRAGIIGGKPDGSYDPAGTASRAEVAAILKNFIEASE